MSLTAHPSSASEAAEAHRVNDHRFISAPTNLGQLNLIMYQVCNSSGRPSVFLWSKAGFGVENQRSLSSGWCVTKRRYSTAPHSVVPANVQFQGLPDTPIPTYVPCSVFVSHSSCGPGRLSDVYWWLSDLAFDAPDADRFQIKSVSTQVTRDRSGSSASIHLRSSENVNRVFIVFPDARNDVEGVRAAISDQGDLKVQLYSAIKEQEKLDASILDTDIQPDAVAISLPATTAQGYDRAIAVNSLKPFAGRAVVLVISDGRIVARDEIEFAPG
jgi:hypothetical protein